MVAIRYKNGKRNRIGERYGLLTIIADGGSINKKVSLWVCKCDCGNQIAVRGGNLNSGNTTSCGCLREAIRGKSALKHGNNLKIGRTPEYRSWIGMKSRCYNKNNKAYDNYGGRGIVVCDRWLDDRDGFNNFLQDMGKKPSHKHSLDRFPNNDGNYEPANCRWGTGAEQSKNRRSNRWYEYDGKKMVQKDWAISVGADNRQFHRMLKRKSFEETLLHFKNRQYGIFYSSRKNG